MTHLLHQALRHRLGEHVTQKGSLVAPDRMRFDFSQPRPLTDADIAAIESEVNARIRANGEVRTRLLTPDAAVAEGALALFGEKYGDEVRVVAMGGDGGEEKPFSVELCGGTHVRRTGDVGLFKIVGESSVASGVRRIEALRAGAAAEHLAEEEGLLRQVGGGAADEPGGIAGAPDAADGRASPAGARIGRGAPRSGRRVAGARRRRRRESGIGDIDFSTGASSMTCRAGNCEPQADDLKETDRLGGRGGRVEGRGQGGDRRRRDRRSDRAVRCGRVGPSRRRGGRRQGRRRAAGHGAGRGARRGAGGCRAGRGRGGRSRDRRDEPAPIRGAAGPARYLGIKSPKFNLQAFVLAEGFPQPSTAFFGRRP